MKTVLITGGTGLVGTQLSAMLIENGLEVIVLTRDASNRQAQKGIRYANWDPGKGTIDAKAIADADAIVHLAGAGVADKRWSKKRKEEIVSSRTESSALLVKALREIPNKVSVVVSASGIGWYGEDGPGNIPFREEAPAADNFLADTCVKWENSIRGVEAQGKRLVIFRTGLVLSTNGGAYPEFIRPIRFGIAPILGNGMQVYSWIHIMDLCRMFFYAITEPGLSGVFNAVAPGPVSNRKLMTEIMVRKRPQFCIPIYVPSFVLKIMLGGMSIEVLKSTTVSSEKIHGFGFRFLYPQIESAVSELTGRS